MTRVQRGDMQAFRELIDRYRTRVYRIVNGYHRNPEDALEVVQDTFLKVYNARGTWERRTAFTSWLYRIAINASIDRYRRRDKVRKASLDDIPAARGRDSATVLRVANPLETLRASERRRILEDAVRRLPDRQREVVSLRYFGELQLEEIAATLGCPLGTVKSNLHKAVHGLRRMLLEQTEVLNHE